MSVRRVLGSLAGIALLGAALAACGSNATATPAAAPPTAAPPTAVASATPAPTATATTTAAATPSRAGSPAGGSPAAAGGDRYTIVQESSKAQYTAHETFAGRSLSEAVGSTSVISGDLFINKQKPSASSIGTITVDISKLTSDQGQRDRAIRGQWLESNKFPQATFKATKIEGLPDTPYTDGQELTFKVTGDLTVRNVTKPVTFDAKGKIEGDTFKGTARTQFNMTDFGFQPPDIAGTLKAENGVTLDMTIEAKRAP